MTPDSSHYKCIEIKNDGITIIEDLYRARMAFWDNIYSEYMNVNIELPLT